MSDSIARKAPDATGLEKVLLEGNLAGLSATQRVVYYQKVCESVGLNPLTQPFEYLTLQGKTVLYAKRACTDQLRKIHGVGIKIVAREKLEGVYVVTARAEMPDGRCDESIGAVPIEDMKGEALANALMKAETKAKRRVTLAICGLSVLDESELDGVKDKITREPAQRKTLDAVAEVDPTRDAEPKHVQAEKLDELGIPMPSTECPVIAHGKANAGKKWSELPAGLVRKMYTDFGKSMSKDQRDWCEYLILRHAQQKHDAMEGPHSLDEGWKPPKGWKP